MSATQTNKSLRTPSLDLIRLYMSIWIAVFHFMSILHLSDKPIGSITIFVDFFFAITGFFMALHIMNPHNSNEYQIEYLLKKTMTFFFPLIIVNIVQLILYCINNDVNTLVDFLRTLWHFKYDFFNLSSAGMLQNPQFNSDFLVGSTWYLSAMMLSLIFCYPLYRYYRTAYVTIIGPLLILMTYSSFIQTYGTNNVGASFAFPLMDALMRGVAGITVGVLAFEGYSYFKDKNLSQIGWLMIIDTVCWLCIPFVTILPFLEIEETGFFFMIPFVVVLISAGLNISPVAKFLNSVPGRISDACGQLSLYIYLAHWSVLYIIANFLTDIGLSVKIILYAVFTLLYSALLHAWHLKWISFKLLKKMKRETKET